MSQGCCETWWMVIGYQGVFQVYPRLRSEVDGLGQPETSVYATDSHLIAKLVAKLALDSLGKT